MNYEIWLWVMAGLLVLIALGLYIVIAEMAEDEMEEPIENIPPKHSPWGED